MLALKHLQEVEKKSDLRNKSTVSRSFQKSENRILSNDKMELAEREFLAGFSIMRNDACLFDYFGISVD